MIDAYENYYKYNLSADPFRLSPDHRFAFSHASYAKARAYLEFAMRRGEGFITITGAPGTGKTTLINEIVASIGDSDVLLATLNSTQLESRDLLHMVAAAFGLRYGDVSKATLLLGLEEFLTGQQRKNKRAVLIVDEAQGLSPGAVEELRLLANLQCQHRLLLQVVLVGQEQLSDLVKAPGMEHLSQRIIVATHLEPLNLPDTVTYIEHRLRKVRWRGDPAITEDALRLIHTFSGGVPRRINLICSRLFLFGGLEGKQELGGEDAQIVISDLQKESLLPDTPPERAAAEDGLQTGDLVLSLPRAHTSGAAESAQAVGDQGGNEKRPGHGAEAEDILASRAPLREALSQVFTVLDEQPSEADAGHRFRADQRAGVPMGAGRKPGPAGHGRTRKAPAPGPSAALAADQLAARSARPHKRRNLVAFLTVAAGLALAFSLTRLDRGDMQTDGGKANRPSASLAIPVNPPAEDAIKRNADETASRGIEPEDDAIGAGSDASKDSATDDQVTLAPESLPKSEPEPQSVTLSGAEPSDGATDTPAAEALPTASQEPDISSRNTPGAATEPSNLPPEKKASAVAPAVAPVPQPTPVAESGSPPAADRDDIGTKTAPSGSQASAPARPSSAEIEAEKARLAEEARVRFAREMAKAEAETARRDIVASAPVRPAPVATRTGMPQPSQPKISPVPRSMPKVAVARPAQPAAPPVQPQAPVDTKGRIKSMLLQGQWTSQEQPASLLPSDITLCKDEQSTISCWSVPRNISTQYGEALYKVEATLRDFSTGGNFEILYKTLVKLVGSPGSGDSPPKADKDNWQASEHTTKCQLTQPDRVSCRDEKGVTREYRR